MAEAFTELERAAWGGFLRTFTALDQAIDADLQEHDGLRHSEFEVLLRLSLAPDHRLRIQDLTDASLLTRSGTSRLVDRLAQAGLVSRAEDPSDGRVHYAVLTSKGRAAFDRIRDRHIAFVRDRFHSRLTEKELTALAGIWIKLNAAS